MRGPVTIATLWGTLAFMTASGYPRPVDALSSAPAPERRPTADSRNPGKAAIERIAVETVGLDQEYCSIEHVPQRFWSHHRIVRIFDDQWPHISPFVAVGSDWRGYLLTADAIADQEKPSLDRINDIAIQENVAIDQKNAKSYIEFILRIYYSQRGVFFPNERLIQLILDTPLYSEEDELLAQLVESQEEVIVSPPTMHDSGFSAWTYSWAYWAGVVERHEVSVSRSGEAFVHTEYYGIQPEPD